MVITRSVFVLVIKHQIFVFKYLQFLAMFLTIYYLLNLLLVHIERDLANIYINNRRLCLIPTLMITY
jgi:hypothetical protein